MQITSRVNPPYKIPDYTSRQKYPKNQQMVSQAKKAKSTITETTPFINFLLALFGLGKRG